jgi:hypothetical protein
MLETWDWYLERYYDYKVMDVVKHPKSWHFVSPDSHHVIDSPYTIKEISEQLSRSQNSVRRSLRRLERHGKVVERSSGWEVKGQ